MNGSERTTRRQRRSSAFEDEVARHCAFGQPTVPVSTTITITTVDGAEVLVVRDLSARETHEALRVFRQLFPKDAGYVYTIDARVTPGGDAA